MNLNLALDRHAQWKTNLRAAIFAQSTVDEATLAKDDCCDLGKWLYGEGKEKLSHLTGFTEAVSKHAEFHREVGKVARVINDKKFAEAEAMLGTGTSYATASNAIGVAIMRLKKEANL